MQHPMPQKKQFNKKTEYEKQREIWYKKLKKSGFEDIEQDDFNLKTNSSVFFKNHTFEVWTAKATYYQMASNFLEEYKFNSRIEKVIWEYHSNGISFRDISKLLKKAKIKSISTNRQDIWLIVKRLKATMYSMYTAPKEEYHE